MNPALRAVLLSPAFKPEHLFRSGAQGGLYDWALNSYSSLYQDSAGTTPVTALEQPVGRIVDTGGRGNHLVQATATKRMTLLARYNVLLATELLSGASWTKRGAASVAASAAPDGTGETVTGLGAKGADDFYQTAVGSVAAGVRCEPHVKVWPVSLLGTVHLANSANALNGDWVIDLALLTPGQWNTVTRAHAAVTVSVEFSGAAGSAGHHYWCTSGGPVSFYIKHPDLRLTADASLPSYQRVNTATDYDSAGFPVGERLDGADDNATCATGGGATTRFFLCMGVKPLGGAGAARTIWSDTGTNTGYRVRINASNKLELAAGNNVAYTTVESAATLPVGETHIVTAWHDGVNLSVQIDGGAIATAAFATATAGTAGFTVGSDNGAASSFFNGMLYPGVYLSNENPSETMREKMKKWINRNRLNSVVTL